LPKDKLQTLDEKVQSNSKLGIYVSQEDILKNRNDKTIAMRGGKLGMYGGWEERPALEEIHRANALMREQSNDVQQTLIIEHEEALSKIG
jgi:hypothetical protein